MSRPLQGLATGAIDRHAFPGATGAGVRVAVIDSGVDLTRLGADRILAGVTFGSAGTESPGAIDRHGHGTAVVTTIRAIAPDTSVIPVKVFDRDLSATADALVAAIDWATRSRVHLINLSLGTTNRTHRLRLGEALVRAARAGVAVIAADVDEAGTAWLPGSLPLAVGVSMDRAVARDTAVISVTQEGAVRRLRACACGVATAIERPAAATDDAPGGSGRPAGSADEPDSPAGGEPAGVSFAVATVTGLIALHLSSAPRA